MCGVDPGSEAEWMSEVWGVGIGECVVWTQAVREKEWMSEVWGVGRW